MTAKNNFELFTTLRHKFPVFTFESYSIKSSEAALLIQFEFNISDAFIFRPEIEIPTGPHIKKDKLSDSILHNLVCHLGMIEMLSYWKAACPPKIIVKPFSLTPQMIAWWKGLYLKGLGEFLYLNGINTTADAFVEITSTCTSPPPQPFNLPLRDANIIPVGGGKDSAVTFQLLSEAGHDNLVMFLNPQHLPVAVIPEIIRKQKSISIYRRIDPLLLKLNNEGFLNGHTPFSALLAFLSLLTAALTGVKNIVLSNESSANEPTVPGTDINHQYSKTWAFENDFRSYVAAYMSADFNYFSFLRPLNEIQIAMIFSRYPDFFDTFRSCNAGSKQGIWCCKCSKCLFTFILLSGFLKPDTMFGIFGCDMFEKADMKPVFDSLTGASEIKPFDCVGTIDDVNTALVNAVKLRSNKHLPVLLKGYAESKLFEIYNAKPVNAMTSQFDSAHFLPLPFKKILLQALSIQTV